MQRLSIFAVIGVLILVTGTGRVGAAGRAGLAAPDIPPGIFTDNKTYALQDYRGKVVVLWFFYVKDPQWTTTLGPTAKLLKTYKDKPLVVLGVAPEATFGEAANFVRNAGLGIPTYPDTVGAVWHRYSGKSTIDKEKQAFRIIGADGALAGTTCDAVTLDAALSKAKARFRAAGYDKRLNPVIDLLESGAYAEGAQRLRALRADKNPAVQEGANKLYDQLKALGKDWETEAEGLLLDSITASAIYTRIQAVFTGDELAKHAEAQLQKLKADKTAQNDLVAQSNFQRLNTMMSNIDPQRLTAKKERSDVLAIRNFCEQFMKAFPGTPAAKKAEALLHDLPTK